MANLLRLVDQAGDYYDGVLEYQALLEVEQVLLDELQANTEAQAANQFVMTADSDGLALYETMLGISTDLALSLDSRRYNILTHLVPPEPLTLLYLQYLLSLFNVNASVSLSPTEPFHLDIDFTSTDPSSAARMNALLLKIVPCNLTYSLVNISGETEGSEQYEGVGNTISITETNTTQELPYATENDVIGNLAAITRQDIAPEGGSN